MSLFAEPIRMTLPPRDVEVVTRPIVGPGGAQGFLRAIVARLSSTGELELDDAELQRVHRYADYNDGAGGFQDRFKAIRAAAWRAGWVQP